ncbi:CoA-transferase subunit beta [bacterium]|nr:CoA-transferase subunit beta [bacterium]
MVCRAAEELANKEVVFVGIGLPNVACNLAKETHAPELFMIYESGAVGTLPERLPVSIGDPALVTDSASICSVADIFQCYLQRGNISVGFLSGAQIDRYGNLNTTAIGGDYSNPKVRLPGSGGACEIAIHSKKVFIIMRLNDRAFVEKCDFITSVGRKVGEQTRSQLGCPGAGPVKVITDMCVMDFNDQEEMIVTELFPGVSKEQVQAKCGFKLNFSDKLKELKDPPEGHIRLLRDKLDPKGMYI